MKEAGTVADWSNDHDLLLAVRDGDTALDAAYRRTVTVRPYPPGMARSGKKKLKTVADLHALYRRPDPWPTTTSIELGEDVDIVGESHYVDAIRSATDGDDEVTVVGCLIPEPSNPYDPDAIAVHAPTGVVGYLAKPMTGMFRESVDVCIVACGYCAIRLDLYDGKYPYARIGAGSFSAAPKPPPPPPAPTVALPPPPAPTPTPPPPPPAPLAVDLSHLPPPPVPRPDLPPPPV